MTTLKEKENLMFIRETGIKLNLSPPTYASAAVYYTFTRDLETNINREILVISNINLACKNHEENAKFLDIVSVANHTFFTYYPKEFKEFLTNEDFHEYSEACHICEYTILTQLKFKITLNHPHLYMLIFLKMFLDWIPFKENSIDDTFPAKDHIYHTALSLLNDTYLDVPLILDLYKNCTIVKSPPVYALAIIYLTLNIALKKGIEIYEENNKGIFSNNILKKDWWKIFNENIVEDDLKNICCFILDIYNK